MIKIYTINTAQELLAYLYKRFHSLQNVKGLESGIEIIGLDSESLKQKLLSGEANIIVLDSSLMLEKWEQEWRRTNLTEQKLIQEFSTFALTPMIIAMRPGLALVLGYPKQNIGWRNIFEKLKSEKIQLAHANEKSSSGLLTNFIMLYASTNKINSLTLSDIQSDTAQSFIENLQQAIYLYGSSDYDVINHAIKDGDWRIDAMSVQESSVLQFAFEDLEKITIVSPADGTLWADYCISRTSRQSLNEQDLETYIIFRDYLLSSDAQAFIPRFGFRALESKANDPRIDIESNQTSHSLKLLEQPSSDILSLATIQFAKTKRRTSIMMVSDISGSMRGEKMLQAKAGMINFLNQIENDDEYAGIITFESAVKEVVPLGALKLTRQTLESEIGKLNAGGGTALFDAVDIAYKSLQTRYSLNRIHAIVVMTDGGETGESKINLETLVNNLESANNTGRGIVIFCIAYGGDAKMDILKKIADATGGSVVDGTTENIKNIYHYISQFFY